MHSQHGVQQAGHLVAQQAAGIAGEYSVARGLSGLPDDWTLLRGYRNRRGETDHVLVGPSGVWAIEVKLRRARLHVDGERWWIEKLDKYGNIVGTEPAVDGGGRTWARQVTDVAQDFAAWLARNQHAVRVHTGVLIMHPQAQLGRCAELGVDLLGNQAAHLIQALQRQTAELDPQACGQIVDLIRRDHQHHHNRRKQRRS